VEAIRAEVGIVIMPPEMAGAGVPVPLVLGADGITVRQRQAAVLPNGRRHRLLGELRCRIRARGRRLRGQRT
jgi:hypothetical protein